MQNFSSVSYIKLNPISKDLKSEFVGCFRVSSAVSGCRFWANPTLPAAYRRHSRRMDGSERGGRQDALATSPWRPGVVTGRPPALPWRRRRRRRTCSGVGSNFSNARSHRDAHAPLYVGFATSHPQCLTVDYWLPILGKYRRTPPTARRPRYTYSGFWTEHYVCPRRALVSGLPCARSRCTFFVDINCGNRNSCSRA